MEESKYEKSSHLPACRPMLSAGARDLTVFVAAFACVVLFTSPVCALADSMSLSIAPDPVANLAS
ncbi:MAG TPA: hypothetical protein VGL57_13250 [Solirubrobacteraceae bacterium]